MRPWLVQISPHQEPALEDPASWQVAAPWFLVPHSLGKCVFARTVPTQADLPRQHCRLWRWFLLLASPWGVSGSGICECLCLIEFTRLVARRASQA